MKDMKTGCSLDWNAYEIASGYAWADMRSRKLRARAKWLISGCKDYDQYESISDWSHRYAVYFQRRFEKLCQGLRKGMEEAL